MEDILYFLMLAGWLAFSFYQQNEKKKRKLVAKAEAERVQAERMREMTQTQQVDLPENFEPEKDFKKMLEEILKEEHEEPLETVTAQEVTRNYDEEAVEDRNVYQKYLESSLLQERKSLETQYGYDSMLDDKINLLQKEMQLKEEEELKLAKKPALSHFNLRSAVIYSEILNRKY